MSRTVNASRDIKVDISRIDKYAPDKLIGREDELKLLNDAWAKTQNHEKGRPHVLTFVALGGEGKTSLIAKWAAELASQNWRGCDAAFAWSFYSQGTRETQAASSDLFLKEALNFFAEGDPKEAEIKEFAASPAGAYEKGRRLARVVGQRRNLLILDGLEPLQHSPTSPVRGELKDQGIATLLKGLAANSCGLCLVTTRYSLPDLHAYWQTTTLEKQLLRLSNPGGVRLLQKLGVRKESGSQAEFEKLVEDVKGHALTLNLLGTFLRDAHAGDIRKRYLVKLADADPEELGGHAFRVMDAYVKWLESDGERGKHALAILRLLGLFDRPATADCFGTLWKTPAIANLTEPLMEMNEAQRNLVLKRLEDAKLLTLNREKSNELISLDAHPLLREYFARQLHEQQPDAWRTAHQRLYEHLCKHKEGNQPTLEDLQPLYQAVAHGCTAELYVKAYSVFFKRILRGYEFYSAMRLGSFQLDLGIVSGFFTSLVNPKQPKLGIISNATLHSHLGYCLRASQQLKDSLKFLELAYQNYSDGGQIDDAVIVLGVLCYCQIMLGWLDVAEKTAVREVKIAVGAEPWVQITAHSRIAEVYSYMGKDRDADSAFDYTFKEFGAGRSAFAGIEQYFDQLKEHKQQNAIIGALIRRCEFAVAASRYSDAIEWTELLNRLLEKGFRHNELHSGLACLFKGQAVLGQTHESGNQTSNLANAKSLLEKALEHFRRGSVPNEVPRTLLALASITFLEKQSLSKEDLESTCTLLDEAWEIADRGSMQLYMADIHLYRARLFFREAQYPWNQNPDGSPRGPADDLDAAEQLINKCGYHRRDEELADAKRAILGK